MDDRTEDRDRALAERHGVSADAVRTVREALRRGNGMAQFSHPDFGGLSQWAPGMTMVGDMFDTEARGRLDRLATELAGERTREQPTGGSATSREQRSWWPESLGQPHATGGQNDVRYAVFADRLAVEERGRLSVYDTTGRAISGIGQQQGGATAALTFTGGQGPVPLEELRKLDRW